MDQDEARQLKLVEEAKKAKIAYEMHCGVGEEIFRPMEGASGVATTDSGYKALRYRHALIPKLFLDVVKSPSEEKKNLARRPGRVFLSPVTDQEKHNPPLVQNLSLIRADIEKMRMKGGQHYSRTARKVRDARSMTTNPQLDMLDLGWTRSTTSMATEMQYQNATEKPKNWVSTSCM
ncbi:hypothetical protein SEMRO_956_G224480.1 [Seminavis robusta]|uniref:Uncharacterized protein n=1 Tax=Seminavis robusta TaxID=568900 RepID=A0A9N8EDB2_9STRA|nr:hypothetical protein SEMRO_956_G224480.1 [Seminavis robusta]|eukprot:Sro956_g224480.1 n/a (177) ;mRNA; r:8130-8660